MYRFPDVCLHFKVAVQYFKVEATGDYTYLRPIEDHSCPRASVTCDCQRSKVEYDIESIIFPFTAPCGN